MRNSQEFYQPKHNPNPSINAHQRTQESIPKNGLSQDVIQVTSAEPDVCLEVFYALYNTLWPQIEKQSDVSFKDAWINFIGGSVFKGSLCPPEKLITERRVRDLKKLLSQPEGETKVFKDLDQVSSSVLHLKNKIENCQSQILQKEDIMASLGLVQEFYQSYRNKVKGLVQAIIEKEQNNVSHTSESDALEDLFEPKAVMMSDIFTHHWAYRISRTQAQKLLSLDTNGRHLKSNLNDPANHRVIALPEDSNEPLVFFKANRSAPIQPEKEFILYSIYQNLQIPAPETTLLILTDVFETNSEYCYAVQASEAVIGEPPFKACRDPENIFDHEAYVSQVIGAFLTNPSDGSFQNFKYSPKYQTFISIDNDQVFKPELIGKDDRKVIIVKSMLYLFSQMDLPILESLKTFFTTLNPHLTTLSWLQDLSQKNREYQLLYTRLAFQRTRCIYQNLLPQSEVPSLAACLQKKVQVDPELHGESFYPQILLSKGLLTRFVEKLELIEKTLRTNCSINTQTLFEEISPVLAKYYRKLRFEFNDPEEAEEALWGTKKNGIDYSFLSSFLDQEELKDLLHSKELYENLPPDAFFNEYKNLLASGSSPLDGFIRRHSQRKKKNVLNLQAVLKELQFLVQEGLTDSQSISEIIDFCHSLPKMIENNHQKEIISLFSNIHHPELKWLFVLEKYFLRSERFVPKDLLPSSEAVIGALMQQRIFLMTKSERNYLFDQHGNIKKKASLTGRSSVTYFPKENPEFYLKQPPEWPGYEFASTLFMRLLGIQHLPYHDLLIINSKCPVLLTQKVHGHPIFHIWHNSEAFCNLDPVQTGLLIIAAMLINPEDGKEDNFILSKDGKYLIPIDNDHCFLPSTFQKEGNFWNAFTVNTALQTKTLLFCLDEMRMPLPPEVKKHVLSLNFDMLLTQWLTELDRLENKFNNLVDQNQRNKFLEQGTVLIILFYKQFIRNLYWKAHKIQHILSAASEITPFDLLKAVEPFVAKCYQDSFKQENNLQNRFKAATDNLYKKNGVGGSRVSILNTRNMAKIINVPAENLQDGTTFQKMGPVDALELLNQLIQERNQKATMEHEMLCELDEKEQEKKWFSLFGSPPIETALKAFFTNPKEGLILKGSKLITSSKLTELFAQTPDKGVRIRFLSLPESPRLTDKEIRILAEGCPNIEYLNVSSCAKLKEIITVEGEWPSLTRLEAQDCLNLEKLVSSSPIKILRIGTEKKIEIFVEKSTLDIFSISREKIGFEFSLKKSQSFQIKCPDMNISSDNFERSVLDPVQFCKIRLHFVDIKIKTGMFSLASGEDLARFISDLNFRGLKVKISKILFLKLVHLKRLDLSANTITDDEIGILTQGNWPSLEILNLENTKISTAGVEIIIKKSNWPQLKHIDLSANEIHDGGLEILTRGNWSLLETLKLANTKISTAGIEVIIKKSDWPLMKHLNLSENAIQDDGIEILTQGNWFLLEVLNLKSTKITTEGVKVIINRSNWPHLKDLDLSLNDIDNDGIEALTHGNWLLLETLNLSSTGVTKKALPSFLFHANWPNLKKTTLPECWDSADRNFAEIFLKKNFSQMEWLVIKSFDRTFETMFKKYECPTLKYLKISDNEISLGGISALALGKFPLLEELHMENIKITLKGLESIVNTAKWPQLLKHLNISHNEISDKGLSVLALVRWPFLEELGLKNTKITSQGIKILVKKIHLPNLKKLDISQNLIFDRGLKVLLSGTWPLFQHLVYYETKVTFEGQMVLLENFKWPDLHQLEHSLCESFYQNRENENPPGIILVNVPMFYRDSSHHWESLLVTVLDITWFSSKEIRLSIRSNNLSEKIMILPRDRLDHQLESIYLPFFPQLKPLQFIVWPPNLKRLDINGQKITELFSQKCALLEDLCLGTAGSTTEGLDILINKPDWPNLKNLDVSYNLIQTKGFELLASGKWPLLESLKVSSKDTTSEGLKILINESNWPCLKKLNLSHNKIRDEGLEVLASAKWPLLESLDLKCTKIKVQGLEILIKTTKWQNLKEIHISHNSIRNEGLKVLASARWPLLESLDLQCTKINVQGLEVLRETVKWPNLKEINISHNQIGDKGVEVLASAKWPLLESLGLKCINIKLQGLEVLQKTVKWPNLKEINISHNSIRNEGLKVLASAKWPLLESLDLECTEIKVQGLEVLRETVMWTNLKEINISHNQIGDKGVEVLASAQWPLLKNFKANSNMISAQGIRVLVEESNWPNLELLDLSENGIGNAGVRALSFGKWPLLASLSLRNNDLTGEFESLLTSSNWPNLWLLDISWNSPLLFKNSTPERWPLLEVLSLTRTNMTMKDVETLVNNSSRLNLKEISFYGNIQDHAEIIVVQKLFYGKWPGVKLGMIK